MSIKEMLRTLDTSRLFPPPEKRTKPPEKPPIDWVIRNTLKRYIFFIHIKALAIIILCSVLFLILPLWIIAPPIGKAFLLSIAPMLLICTSWMVPAWKFYDRRLLMLSLTMGMMPIRILLIVAFSYLVLFYMPQIHFPAFGVAMMWHWVVFFIPEVSMVYQLSTRLERTIEEEPKIIIIA